MVGKSEILVLSEQLRGHQMHTQKLFLKQTIDHFYLGVIMTTVYVFTSPWIIEKGYSSMAALLFIEVAVLAPIVSFHLYYKARQLGTPGALGQIIQFRKPLSKKAFLAWTIGGLAAIIAVYVPLYPLGLFMREEYFNWLPEWYFSPSYGVENMELLAKVFLIGILIDGIIGPVAEELFFRGYLLPRMAYLKAWAPIVNGAFFGLYHFWQPHNLVALVFVGVILSYIVWKTKNVYLGIAIHCSLNIIGALGGYIAVTGGTELAR
jgi:membrane protease YdiL (CAAX protease family)